MARPGVALARTGIAVPSPISIPIWLLISILVSILVLAGCRSEPLLPEPRAARHPHAVLVPEGAIPDPYHWLRDDLRRDPDVLDHLRKENAYSDTVLAPLAALRGRLMEEWAQRGRRTEALSWQKNGHRYRIEHEPGSGQWRLTRSSFRPDGRTRSEPDRQPSGAREETLIDRDALSQDVPELRIVDWDLDGAGRRLAWLQQQPGKSSFQLMIRDLETGRLLDPDIDGVSSMAWSGDGHWLFLALVDPVTLRSDRVVRVDAFGRDPVPVYEEPDRAFRVAVRRTRSDRFVTVELRATDQSEVRIVHDREAAESIQVPASTSPLVERSPGHLYQADHVGDSWVLRSNREAPNFRLVEVDEARRADDPSAWRELVGHAGDRMVLEFDVFERHLAWIERIDGQRRLRVLDRRSKAIDAVDFGPHAHVVRLAHNPDPDADTLQFTYSTPFDPPSRWRYDLRSGKAQPMEDGSIGGGRGFEQQSERIELEARDGRRIPVTLVAHRDTALDGRAPLLVEAYGAYGQSLEPDFQFERSSLLERGFVLALAHVRGGQERGRAWYDDGRGLNKPNAIHDLIDVVDGLRHSGRIDPHRVYARGASAGGLLVAAAANMAPQHFHAIVARVPFVDVVQTMLDPSLPLTTQEYREWGDPRRSDHLDSMLRWSPYQNVRRQAYPAMFVTAGLWDAQVPYWVPVKWVARLREMRTDREPLLLQIDLQGGHDGPGSAGQRFRQRAMEVAFLLDRAGCGEEGPCAGSG